MARLEVQPLILAGEGWGDYGLIDSGHGRKVERYGAYRFVRPEPQAMWAPRLTHWDAHGEFVPGSDEDGGGRWQFGQPVPREGWPLAWGEVGFTAQCTPFRHLGFFPDMAPVWDWMGERLAGKADAATPNRANVGKADAATTNRANVGKADAATTNRALAGKSSDAAVTSKAAAGNKSSDAAQNNKSNDSLMYQ